MQLKGKKGGVATRRGRRGQGLVGRAIQRVAGGHGAEGAFGAVIELPRNPGSNADF